MSEELVQELKTDILAQVEAKTINTKKRLNMTTLKGKITGIKGSQRTALLTKLLAADESPANVQTDYKHAVSLLFGYTRSKAGGRRKNKKTRKQHK